jgi:hypothetical protein
MKCNFCDNESSSKVVKIRSGFIAETNLCNEHKLNLSNDFSKIIRDFITEIKDSRTIEQFIVDNEVLIVESVNKANIHCECGTNAEMYLSTGFPVCKKCPEMIIEIKSLLSDIFKNEEKPVKSKKEKKVKEPKEDIVESKVEIIEIQPTILPVQESTINDKIKEKLSKIEKINKEITKLIKEEKFEKCIELKKNILEIEKEIAELEISDKNLD